MAIVLKLDEYRRSLDVDFLCASVDGYRELHCAATERGLSAFFGSMKALRDLRIDPYGLRTILEFEGLQIKFEIIRKGLVALGGVMDAELGVPTLEFEDMVTEKLLANADRCQDRSVAYRDAFDLGMMIEHFCALPSELIEKAKADYGSDVEQKLGWITDRLEDDAERRAAADALEMEDATASLAVSALRREIARLSLKPEIHS